MKILHVVGARPNFVKVAPVMRALRKYSQVEQILLHTGQHYDAEMSDAFFHDLAIPEPEINLGVGSGTHAQQTAKIMDRIEPVLIGAKPDRVLVYGDVNSTVAAALVCAKLLISVAHVEAGLRSFDRSMPEEINRILTDHIADLHFTPSHDASENLLKEGIDKGMVQLVGNVMIDSLVNVLPFAETAWKSQKKQIGTDKFGLVTLHRPSNVDDASTLALIIEELRRISNDIPLVFPVHPRSVSQVKALLGAGKSDRLQIIPPLGYVDFLGLQKHAMFVITDSGGLQEEATYLNIPCFTVRENTERLVTVTHGTNTIVGRNMTLLGEHVRGVLAGKGKAGAIPPFWDGHTSDRIAKILSN